MNHASRAHFGSLVSSNKPPASGRSVQRATLQVDHVLQGHSLQHQSWSPEQAQTVLSSLEETWMRSHTSLSGPVEVHAAAVQRSTVSGAAAPRAEAERIRRARQAFASSSKAAAGANTSRSSTYSSNALPAVDDLARSSNSSRVGSRPSRPSTSSSSSARPLQSSSTSSRTTNVIAPTEPDAAALDAARLGTNHALALRTVMDLWHLYTEHDNKRQARLAAAAAAHWNTAQLPAEPPRLLTAEEEAALGSVVQQYRKLVQLHRDQPDVAAALDPQPGEAGSLPDMQLQLDTAASHAGLVFPASASSVSRPASPAGAGTAAFLSSSSSSSSEDSSPSSSRSSTSSRGPVLDLKGRRVHGNTKWPPPLRDVDVQELCGMSRAWRAMLPELAARAQQLLVLYNTRLIPHMLQFIRRSRRANQLPTDDLLSVGLVGLRRAAARYDPARKTRFSTIATVWILQGMQRATHEQHGSFHTPHRHREIQRHVLQRYGPATMEEYKQQTDMLQQVAAAFKTKPSTVLQALRSTTAAANTASLDAPSYTGPASAKGEDSVVPWAAMLTSTDLDDEPDDGPSNGPNIGVAGHGSFFAAAGQVPGWMQQVQQHQGSSSSSTMGSGSAAGSPMQTLLSTHDDAELRSEQQVQQLMEVLTPRERGVIQLLYGNNAAGLLQAAEASSSSSSGEKAGWESRSGWATAATSAAGVGPRQAGSKGPRGSRQAVIKGGLPLAAVGECYGLSVERTRQVRLAALRKLQAAAAAHGLLSASADSSTDESSLPPADAEKAAAAAAVDPAAVDAAVSACGARVRPMLQLLHSYYSQQGRVPTADVQIAGRHLGRWCARQVKQHEQGKLSQPLLAALQLLAPGWLPHTAGTQQQQQQQQQQQEQQQEQPSRRRRRQQQQQQGSRVPVQKQQQQEHKPQVPAVSSPGLGQGQGRLLRLRQQRQQATRPGPAAPLDGPGSMALNHAAQQQQKQQGHEQQGQAQSDEHGHPAVPALLLSQGREKRQQEH